MIPKGGNRFSEKIGIEQGDKASFRSHRNGSGSKIVAARSIAAMAYLALVGFLIVRNVSQLAPDAAWLDFGGDTAQSLVLNYAYLPRLAISLLCGGALGLAGVLFQQVLQNPLAAPETLAVNAGAHLALTIGVLAFPAFHAGHQELLAVGGALAAWALIAAIGWRRRAEPMTLILTGFVVSFSLGSISSLLMLLHQEYLTSMFIWGAGSLVQDGWSGVSFLAIRFFACALIAVLLVRPLLILGFGDQSATSLGVSLSFVRPSLLGAAVLLSASVVAVVGVIGFVGLAAPHLARLAGAEKLGARLVTAPVAGAALVVLVDQTLQYLVTEQSSLVPTGAVTAILGAPLLVLLLRRIPSLALEGGGVLSFLDSGQTADTPKLLTLLGLACVAALVLALFVGRTPEGLTFGLHAGIGALDWRVPRVVAAAGAGLALGVAGCLVQRLFANHMASPEILGIGGGVAVGLITALLLSAEAGAGMQLAGAALGALAAMGVVLFLGGHRGFAPERLLLIGISITALLDAATLLFVAFGDPRSGMVLAWLGGSTYRATPGLAATVAAIALAGLLAAAPLRRWLDILPLGAAVTKGLGIPLSTARFVVLVLAALTAAAAALIVGPMSFVGLLAPHLAILAGLRRAGPQLLGAAIAGTALVTFADWFGRIAFAPTELPAGILAVLIGTLLVAASVSRAARRNAS